MDTGPNLIMTVQNSTPHQPAGHDPSTGSPAYRTARTGAVVFDRTDQARLRLGGDDRASWLQGLVTNDVAGLRPGAGCYAAYLTAQGRMISDLRVLALDDAFLVDLPPVAAATVAERFEMFVITEDVTVQDVTTTLARLAVHGPSAAETLGAALGADASVHANAAGKRSSDGIVAALEALPEHHSVSLALPQDPATTEFPEPRALVLAATRELGVSGFDVYLPAALLPWLRDRLRTAGGVDGDPDTWETLRIEAGTPVFGVDMGEDTIPLEAGIEDRAISFSKGCYVGQEIIIRVMHRGQGRVAKKLVGLFGPERAQIPGLAAGDVLLSEDQAREVGRVTSATWSPARGRWIGLGYVHRDFIEPGTRLAARGDSVVDVAVEAPQKG